MPYKVMLTKLQKRLASERDPRKREELELEITILLGLIELMKQVQKLADVFLDNDE